MSFTGDAECLDHGDAGDELDHRPGQLIEFTVEDRDLLPHPAHHEGVEREVDRDERQCEKPQPPIDHESVDAQRHRHHHGHGVVHRFVRDQNVQVDHVVLDRFANLTGGVLAEPGQRSPGQCGEHAGTDTAVQPQIGQVRHQQGHEVHEQPDAETTDQEQDHPVDLAAVGFAAGPRRLEQGVAELDQRDERHHRGNPGDCAENLAGQQHRPDRGHQLRQGCLADVVRCGPGALGFGRL